MKRPDACPTFAIFLAKIAAAWPLPQRKAMVRGRLLAMAAQRARTRHSAKFCGAESGRRIM